MSKKPVAILDFGSSHITVLVGNKIINNNFKIIATGESDYAGFIDGEFLEVNSLKDSLSIAIGQVQKNVKQKIEKIFVGVPAEFCSYSLKDIRTTFKNRVLINKKHLDELFSKWEENDLVYTHTIVNKAPIFYMLDEDIKIVNPINSYTKNIWAKTSFIYAENSFIQLISTMIKELGIQNVEFVSSTLAQGRYLLEEDIRQNGAVLIDCGFVSTSIASVVGEGLVDLRSFSIGGGHITGDLSEILKLSYLQSEELKRKLILTVQPNALDYYEVTSDNSPIKVGSKLANDIVLARIDVIGEIIKKCLNEFVYKIQESSPIYLTGGGLTYIRGIKNYLGKVLNRKIIILAPPPLQFNKPDLSSLISLLSTAVEINAI